MPAVWNTRGGGGEVEGDACKSGEETEVAAGCAAIKTHLLERPERGNVLLLRLGAGNTALRLCVFCFCLN